MLIDALSILQLIFLPTVWRSWLGMLFIRPPIINFVFHRSGGSDFFFAVCKKKVCAFLRMCTSTNLHCRDGALLEGKKLNDILFLPATWVTIFAGKSVKHGYGLIIELLSFAFVGKLTQRNEQHD